MKKLYIKTQGCQMNEYDSNKMAAVLKASHGLEVVTEAGDADILLMNTCSIRFKAEEKVFSELGRWRALKAKKPNLVIGVGGCVASQEGQTIHQRAPYVDLVFGPQTLHRLPLLLNEQQAKKKFTMDISFPEIEKFDYLPKSEVKGSSAYVTIMEGCNKFCSFCVVPYTRGKEISRPLNDVVSEILGLAEQGVCEIMLLGQNVNAYLGPLPSGQLADLAYLIHVIAEIPSIQRIRYMTSHPVEFRDSLIAAHGQIEKLSSHIHLPVQSGSNKILAYMKRGHTVKEFLAKIAQLKTLKPNVSFSSDFIIGFPNESEEDFAATLALIDEVRFDQSYSFVYSPRPGTPAAAINDKLSMETKKTRLNIVQARLSQLTAEISQSMVNTVQTVRVLGPDAKNPGHCLGQTENNRKVSFALDEDSALKMCQVKVTACGRNNLQGELVAPNLL